MYPDVCENSPPQANGGPTCKKHKCEQHYEFRLLFQSGFDHVYGIIRFVFILEVILNHNSEKYNILFFEVNLGYLSIMPPD